MKKNAQSRVKICVRIFIINIAKCLKKITYNIFKNTSNALLIIVEITKKIKIY